MAGYSRTEPSDSVLDSIQINTVAFEIQNESFILCVLDSIMVEEEFCTQVKARVAQQTDTPAEHIVVSCIHTHSAPAYFKLAFEDTHVEPELRAGACNSMVESARRAHGSMREAHVELERMYVESLYGNRNVKGGVEDKSCQLLMFRDSSGEPLGALFNLSAHPTILNGSSRVLSADLIGQARLLLEQQLKCPVACVNGTCGDVSTRFFRTTSGIEELTSTAQALVDQFMERREPIALTAGPVRCGRIERPCTYEAATDPDWQDMTARIQKDLDSANPNRSSAFLMDRQLRKRAMGAIHLTLISQFYLAGNLLIVTLPGDICSELGLRIKRAFSDLEVIIIGYANTYCNYLVPSSDYGQYFETFNSRLARGESDAFIESVIGSIESLRAE